ncbi:MAG: hypothetical protein ACYDC5_01975 [Candidatus Dormibacteria bacterium]
MTGSEQGQPPPDSQDPNRSVHGARRRSGPFWIDEPSWYWLVWVAALVLAVALFLLALGFDHP